MENKKNKFYYIYLAGFFIILALPLLAWPPYFFPQDWGKTIIFRSILAVLIFLFAFQLLFKKNEIALPKLKNNFIIWSLLSVFVVFLLSTIFSADSYFSLWGSPYRSGGFINFVFYIVFAVLAFILIKKDDWKKAFNFSIAIGILVSLVAIIQYFSLLPNILAPIPFEPSSTIGNSITLGIYLLLVFFITLTLAIKEFTLNNKQNKYLKIYYIFSLLLFAFTILITLSRAAYLGLVIGILYFFLFYPKKIKKLKIAVICLLILMIGFVFYVNTVNQFPNFLGNNTAFQSIQKQLSFEKVLTDPRFSAWTQIDYNILKEKPILGLGIENFSVGFDKYWNPNISTVNVNLGAEWWDRAHNIIIQTGSDAGFLGIAAYLALFIILFWRLQKTKSKNRNGEKYEEFLMSHAVQAMLIGYFTANLFSFDGFSTYLIFFLLIGYSLHLTYDNFYTQKENNNHKEALWKYAAICVLFLILAIFLWQYNFVPFSINAEINKADDLVKQKQCDQAFDIFDKALAQNSFLNSYIIIDEVQNEKTCSAFYPANSLNYVKKGIEIMNEGVKIEPLYTRYWIWLGNLTATLADQEQNPATKNNLIQQADSYYNKAAQLSPKRQEIFFGKAKLEIVAADYKKAEDYSNQCIALNSALGDCYWYLGISEIYLKDNIDADKNIQLAKQNGYIENSEASLDELVNAYGSIPDYKNLAPVFEKLVIISPDNAQYHFFLADSYAQLGQYDDARQEAVKVLQLSPQSKPNIDAFLSTLP